MSLLLESLKKAALEKKEREKYSDPLKLDAQVQPDVQPQGQSPSLNPKVEATVVNEPPIEKTKTEISTENPEAEKPEAELEFNIDEVEFIIEPSDAAALIETPVAEVSDISLSKIEGKDPVANEIKSEEIRHETTIDQPPSLEKNDQAEIPSAEKINKTNSFTPESGKAALAVLLEKNNKVAHSNKIRRFILVGALFTTGVIILGGYYYFLSDNSNTLSPVNNGGLYVHQSSTDTSLIENSAAAVDTPVTEVSVVENGGVLENTDVESTSVEAPVVETSVTQISDAEKQSSIIERESIQKPIKKQSAVVSEDSKLLASVKKEEEPLKNSEIKSVAVKSRPIESFIQSQPQVEDIVVQTVREAYRAYQQGRWAEAQALYQDALMQDSHNRDALLGAAAVAVRLGNINEALGFYQRQLERDPKDEYAISGIMSLSLDGNKVQLLSEIDKLLQEKPAAVHLLLLKGRLLANQQQWAAAQEVFFDAWRYDKNNADIAYNLAICLDRLSQPQEAIRFYQMALSLKTPAASFSAEMVEKRLASLARVTP